MNVNTSSEWHYDHKNEGPSLLLVVGSHLGGEFECREVHPTKFDGELALIDGRTWHRNHAAWEGERVSFVAFTNSDWKSADRAHLRQLRELGFRPPDPEYLKRWKEPAEFRPEQMKPVRGGRGTVPSRRGDPRLRTESVCSHPASVTSRMRTKSEPVRKGTQTSYKSRGKKQKQEELFPELLKE